MVNKAELILSMAKLVKEKSNSDIRDESNRHGIRMNCRYKEDVIQTKNFKIIFIKVQVLCRISA